MQLGAMLGPGRALSVSGPEAWSIRNWFMLAYLGGVSRRGVSWSSAWSSGRHRPLLRGWGTT